jgi:chorismate-pyruvate lyase
MSELTGALASLRSVEELYALFDEAPPPTLALEPSGMPQPYRRLLAHEGHMTVTLESFHRTRVALEVLAERLRGERYARKILLRHGDSGAVVQYGIMQFDLAHANPELRREILAQEKPLGRALAEHGVLTRVSTHGLLALEPHEELRRCFELPTEWSGPLYGRLATIFCDDHPVVDLLEVVRPETEPGS